jgi:solute carrier family 25 (peroxisomal adenine nucleotide transporter), member 17
MERPNNDTKLPGDDSQKPRKIVVKMGILETISHILRTGGIGEFWRGVGPALVLVINPVLQYTVFEQLKNALVRRRKLRGLLATLTDIDFLILGALSKLGE